MGKDTTIIPSHKGALFIVNSELCCYISQSRYSCVNWVYRKKAVFFTSCYWAVIQHYIFSYGLNNKNT